MYEKRVFNEIEFVKPSVITTIIMIKTLKILNVIYRSEAN